MGLDMYLEKSYYVQNWEHMKPEELHHFTIYKGDKLSAIPTDKITNITTQEMYWRKANAIHKWFVDNVQEGKDDCHRYFVSREQLQKLLQSVNEVIVNHSKANKILPTQEGFFFGGTDYDDYYYQDLEYTKNELEKILSKPEDDGTFYYTSSW